VLRPFALPLRCGRKIPTLKTAAKWWMRCLYTSPSTSMGGYGACRAEALFCGLQPLFRLPLRGSFLRASPADYARGGIPLRTPLARVPADPRLPKPMTHTRPRGIRAPGHSFGIIQTMLLALPNFGLERMGREKPQQI